MTAETRVGPYTLLEELGRGGMGAVYRARREDLDREVALKLLLPQAVEPGESAARFLREARIAAGLAAHPGIVGVHDVGEDGGRIYVAMELVPGRSLERAVDEAELTPLQVAAIGEAVARALQHAHDAGVIHRDVKPANILLDADDRPRLTDFGLARTQAADGRTASLTRSGVILGTPGYMSPEQFRGERAGPPTDIYGLGASLYEAVAGRPPFTGGDTFALLMASLHEPPRPLPRVVPGAPVPLDLIIRRCLAKDPADRYPSASALADDLARFIAGEPIRARPVPVLRRAVRWGRRHRWRLAAGAAVLAGAGAAAAWSWRTAAGEAAREAGVHRERAAARAAERAARLTGVYDRLRLQTLTDLRRLQDHWHGVALAQAEQDAAVGRISAAVLAARAQAEGLGMPEAWLGLALVYVDDGDGVTRTDRAARDHPGDPLAWLLLAQTRLAGYARAADLPEAEFSDRAVHLRPFVETAQSRELRLGAADALRRARNCELWPYLSQHALFDRFVDGAVALSEGRYADAGRLLDGLDDPLLGTDAQLLAALARFLVSDFEGARTAVRPVAERGWAAGFALLGRTLLFRALTAGAGTPAGRAALDDAVRTLTAGVAAQPHERLIRRDLAMTLLARAGAARDAGRPWAADVRRACTELDTLIQAHPDFQPAFLTRGNARWELGQAKIERGTDPRPELQQAVEDLTRAIELAPDETAARANRAGVYTDLGEVAEAHREDARPWYAKARADFAVVIAHDPDNIPARTNRGILAMNGGQLAVRLGEDPAGDFAAALADFDRVLELAPDRQEALVARGTLFRTLGSEAMRAGGDARPHLRRSIADFSTMIELAPDSFFGWVNRATSSVTLIRALTALGEDPFPVMDRALADFGRAIALRPKLPGIYYNRAQLYRSKGDACFARDRDPEPHWRAAIADCDHVLQLQPGFWRADHVAGLVSLNLREWRNAIARFEHVLQAVPGEAEATEALAVARAELAKAGG